MTQTPPSRVPGPCTAFVILVGLNLVLFGDVLFNGEDRVLSSEQNDLFLHFAVWRQFALDQLRQGHIPLWNPHYLCGSPFLGNFESALFYPLFWIGIGMGLPLALNLALVSHVLLAGFFTFLWARHRDISFQGSLLVGVVFMWGGAFYLHLYAGHLPNLTVMTWAPLYFLALDKLLEEEGRSWFFLGVLAISMQVLGGHPQYVYFTSILGLAYILFSSNGKTSRKWIRFVSLYLGAALITAVQWGPGLEAYLESARRIPMDQASAKAFSFPPENILTLFLPDLFGNLHSSPYWGRWYLWEVSLFIGMVPFILAVVGALSGRKGAAKLSLVAGIAFILSLGAFTPLFSIFQWIPGFQGIRGFCKFDFLTGLFLSMLVGKGFDHLRGNRDAKVILKWTAVFGIVIGVSSIVISSSLETGWAGIWGRIFSHVPWIAKTLSVMGSVSKDDYGLETGFQVSGSLLGGSFFSLLFCIFLLVQKMSSLFGLGVLSLSVLELFLFARANRPTFEFQDLQNRFDQVRALYQKDPGDYRVFGSQDAAMGIGGYDIWEDEPMVPVRYAQFLCRTQGIAADKFFSTAPFFTRFNKTFAMVRLKYLLNWGPKGLETYRLPFQPLPRMLLISRWEKAEGEQALDRILDKGFDPRKTVLLRGEPFPKLTEGEPEGKVEWRDISSDAVEVTAEIPKNEVLLITDNYSAGWNIERLPGDSPEHPQVIPADHFLKAVSLAAGRHHFRIVYKPLGFTLGKWTSILSCLLFGAMFLSWRRSSRGPQVRPV